MKEYIGEEEWEEFQPPHNLSPEISGKLWSNIYKNTATSAGHYSWYRWMAVAASALLVTGLSWIFVTKRQNTSIGNAVTVAKTKNIINHTPEKEMLTLSDGSTVELLPSSTLSYPGNFNALKREVVLNGEATFDIARDFAKPFSVHSNSLLITVLGTRFTVNESGIGTKVTLHQGSVMIRISDSVFRDKNEYYLSPGDIFIYKKCLSARILHLEKDKDDDYVFDNYPLDVVFDQLQMIYNTKIVYNNADLGNRTFIGKIDKKDSLSHILKSVVLLNSFGLHKQGDGYMIDAHPNAATPSASSPN